ncbi:MAG: hypothetical protein ACRDF9_07290 [Candidatus Limnocylindria bacterium]
MDELLNPSFMKDPPVKLDIPAKTLGLVCAILAGISTFFGVIGLLGVSALTAVAGTGTLFLVGTVINVAGSALVAWGGYKMYQEDRGGKRFVIYGLVVNAVGGLVGVLSGASLGSWIVNAALAFVVYYIVIISRFEGEPKLVSAVPQPPAGRREGPPAP